MILRDEQYLGYKMAQDSVRQGLNRPILAAGCSYGKTVVAAKMLKACQEKGKIGWFLADRIQLINQAIKTFTAMGIDFGVKQAAHDLTDPTKTVQIVSIQSLDALINKHKKPLPVFDFAIVDEAHTMYKIIDHVMDQYNAIPIIGLTATPYTKGLGDRYNNLLVPITQQEQIANDRIVPLRYYGGEHIDFKDVRSLNPNEFRQKDIERETEAKNDILAGCIVKNWLKYGEDSQTVAFSPTQNLSKTLVEKLNAAGISAMHIDCHFKDEDRQALFEAHDRGEFKVLSCSRLLNTGYDAPSVKCIIDCFPVKSVTTWVQRAGRLQRRFPGKEYGIYLDHADNFSRFGPAENIVPTGLHSGDKSHREKDLIKKEKKEPKVSECPQCMQLMSGYQCRACGYEYPVQVQLEDDGKMLEEIAEAGAKAANKTTPHEVKVQFLSELFLYAKQKGYKQGWASNKYRERFGVWPNHVKPDVYIATSISEDTQGWLTHSMIKYQKSKEAKR